MKTFLNGLYDKTELMTLGYEVAREKARREMLILTEKAFTESPIRFVPISKRVAIHTMVSEAFKHDADDPEFLSALENVQAAMMEVMGVNGYSFTLSDALVEERIVH